MSLYEASVPQLTKMLTNLDRWLEKSVEVAEKRSFDPNVLCLSRLAPDQYPLSRQVQAACDQAKFTAARLTGKEAPKHPDTEQTIEELRQRIKSVIGYLGGFAATDFDNAESRPVDLPFLEGKAMLANDYLTEMALPNFYFHLVHAYAILRHNGVELGKIDFIGALNLRER